MQILQKQLLNFLLKNLLILISEYRKAYDSGTVTEAQAAVYDVCERSESTEYLPSVMSNTVRDGSGNTHNLSSLQYVEFQTDYLRLYWEYVEEKLQEATSQSEKEAILKAAKNV